MADILTPGLHTPPLALYVHIPWCVRKCPYCDFNSHTARSELPEREYLQALLRDLDTEIFRLEQTSGQRTLSSIFFGGGTPSLLSPDIIASIIDGARQRLGFQEDIEITLEANPGTVDEAKFKDLFQGGVNRLSLGVQSFQPELLTTLGRIHNGEDAIRAVHKARQAGFDNFNLDLMHGLPGQSLQHAMEDLDTAISLSPTHLSWYQLTIEPNTEFYRHPPQLPEDDTLWEIHENGCERLAQAGYNQYEISAFAQTGMESRHNLNYWRFGDYLAIGAGAHGKLTGTSGDVIRYWKTRLPQHYLSRIDNYIAGEEVTPAHEAGVDFLMNALRLREGVEEELLLRRTGVGVSLLEPQLSEARQKGWLQADRLQCTELGYRHLNAVLTHFMD
ncbi:radical SAM family heme chaperone HemW [Hahella aquimaris]|uniref:radical SAM family heme chaperone HemW n=1 Tax=Hahella sp. HNIBRBA332 TaxID=3015983 RepID=UPI00273CCE23|nr:radical SAM family heme chaperone HemW [Hahella sp. HNIBRBA332]WLQ13677.1 radical SAM family heme chaperone HemW [Hahella sp. HNIBRBA332]